MAIFDLASSSFWESRTPFVARDPRRPADGEALESWLEAEFPDQASMAFQTSGSEGQAKWVILTRRGFLISAEAVNRHFQVTSEDRWLIAIPEHHVGGFAIHARSFRSGSAVARFDARWDPGAFGRALRDYEISLTSLVPTQVHDLVRCKVQAPPKLRAIAVGGGGMSTELVRAAKELGWPVIQSYGMTEAASQIATQPLESADPTVLEILPHWRLSTEADGRLTVWGEALAVGYAQRQGDSWTFDAIDHKQGLTTRDRVDLFTREGGPSFLTFLGRDRDWVKILGELVHLTPLQRRIDQIANDLGWPVAPVLLAMPDSRTGSKLMLVTEATQPEVKDIVDRYHKSAPSIHRIAGHQGVTCFPRSDLGKIQTAKLEAMLKPNGP